MKSIYIKDKKFTGLPEPVCAAIGNFDGVHLGHQKLIEECKKHGYKSAVLTFYPHPSVFLKKIPNYPLVTPLEKKTDVISKMGIDYLIVVEFNEEIAAMPKEEFIEALHQMNIKACVCGYDFTFARKAEGNISDLAKEFEFYEIKKYVLGDVRVSTTYIRELLATGNIEEANKLLGRQFSIRGNVIYGLQNGRVLGFPTANIDYKNFFLPKNGVYFVNVIVDGEPYLGMANIGHNPTIEYQDKIRLEVNIFGLDEDIYGENIEVYFIKRIRDEKRFESKEDLLKQLKIDKAISLEYAGDLNYTK
ncbi:MAG: bifunctional riboflavin kinase/FAD synthetase [Acholeplasmatales bacterium]|nr:bifunctional riboflavin kinase/FAD synthetase [Acholeplasmatales bacterium]